MNTELFVGLVALVTGLLSGVASWAVSRHQAKAELEKVRMELRHVYATSLQAKRVELYPALYRLLSGFVKQLNNGTTERKDLDDLIAGIDAWDSPHSIFLGIHATEALYDFRYYLYSLRQNIGEGNRLSAEADRIVDQIEKVELALKGDLGVFSVAFYDPESEWFRYSDLQDALRRKASRREQRRTPLLKRTATPHA